MLTTIPAFILALCVPMLGQSMLGQSMLSQSMLGQATLGQSILGQEIIGQNILGQNQPASSTVDKRTSPAARPPSYDIKVDAFVAGSWNGVTFVVDDTTGFQVRVGTRAEGSDLVDGDHVGGFLTGIEDLLNGKPPQGQRAHPAPPGQNLPVFYEAVTEVGPHAPDGSYARLTWNPLYPYDTGSRMHLEWSLLDPTTVLGRITYDAPFGATNYMSGDRTADILLEAYSPLEFQAKYRIENQSASGSSTYRPADWESEWNQWRFNFSSSDPHLAHDQDPGFRSGFSNSTADDSRWQTVRWGAYWQEGPSFIKDRGYGWYRTNIVIPRRLKGRTLRLNLGKISQNDWTYLNGELVGDTSGAAKPREYLIAPGTRAYEKIDWGANNTLAVQVQSDADLGGMSAGPFIKAVRLLPPPRPRMQALASNRRNINFVLVTSKRPDAAGAFRTVDDLRKQLQAEQHRDASDGNLCAGLFFRDLHMENFKRPRDNQLYFVAKVGSQPDSSLRRAARDLLSGRDPGREIEMRRIAYDARRVRVEGAFQGAAEMTTNTVHWNVLYAPEQKRGVVVDSRRWFLPDSWTLFGNSALLSAWAAALESKQLAENTFMATMAEQLPDGRVMNAAGRMVTTPDRSQDMYAAYSAWKIYLKWGDRQFLREAYPRIKAWHEWWFNDRGDGQPWRDGNRDGLLELGNNLSPFGAPQAAPDSEEYGLHHQGAMWEAFDDSPMWGYYVNGLSVHPEPYRGDPKVKYVFRTGTLNLNTAPTNALWALSSDMLVRIAHELGYAQDEQHFRLEYEAIKKRINETLWDEKTGMYLNRFWPEAGGHFSDRKSPALLWMMAAGIPSEAQARRLVYEHLLNPKEFWGKFLLPSVSRDDPAFAEQYYWRGTVWPPVNYFVYEGLKRYGYDDVAAELATRTYDLVKTNWDKTGALWENYNSITGEGDAHGAGGSTRNYAWSAALPLIAIMECIDQEAWGEGLRFGSMGLTRQTRVENLTIQGHEYSASVGPDLTQLRRDAIKVFSIDTAAVIRDFKWDADHATFKIKLNQSIESAMITMNGLNSSEKGRVEIVLDGNRRPVIQIRPSELAFSVSGGEHSVEITISK